MPDRWDDNRWDDDIEDEEDLEEYADDEQTYPCPECGREIYDDSERCPHCGHYISEEDSPPSRPAWWIVLGVLLCLLVIGFWLLQ